MEDVFTQAKGLITGHHEGDMDVLDALFATRGLAWVLERCAKEARGLERPKLSSPVRQTILPDGGIMENLG